MSRFHRAIGNAIRPLVFGLVHLEALPGTPRHCKPLGKIVEKAINEAVLLKEQGLDGIIVENMGDIPYVRPHQMGPEIVAYMARCATEVKQSIEPSNLLMGISLLAACNREALAVAHACDFDFIRAEGFVFGHVADEGYIDGCAGSLLRYRKQIGADHVAVLTDIKKKHSSHAITADVNLADTIHAAEFFLTDGVIVTGTATGQAPNMGDIQEAKRATDKTPIFIGSGLNADNVHEFGPYINGFIVGSDFKKDGHWRNEIDINSVEKFMNRVRQLERNS